MKSVRYFLSIAAVIVLFSGQIALADPNLVAYWMFDEGTGTTAYDSKGDNDGNLMNGPVWTTGQIDGGLSFDGTNDYVNVNNSASLSFSQSSSFTIALWVNPTSSSGELVCKMRTGGRYEGPYYS